MGEQFCLIWQIVDVNKKGDNKQSKDPQKDQFSVIPFFISHSDLTFISFQIVNTVSFSHA